MRLPTRQIDGDSLKLGGPQRRLVLKVLSGHTDSDVVAVVPERARRIHGRSSICEASSFLG